MAQVVMERDAWTEHVASISPADEPRAPLISEGTMRLLAQEPPPTLEERVRALEERLAALEQRE